ncbi:hypothetical protein ES705_48798 [subsurface metagenome]
MPTKTIIGVVIAIVLVTAIAISLSLFIPDRTERIKLPEPSNTSNVSVEEALSKRRSIRAYSGDNLTIAEVSQLLWAAQGITSPGGGRTAPSAADQN